MRCIFSFPAPPHKRTQPHPAVSLLGMWTAQLLRSTVYGKTEFETTSGVTFEWDHVSFLVWCEGVGIMGTGSGGPIVLYYLMGDLWQDSQVEKTTHVLRKGRRIEKVLTLEKLIFLFFHRFWMVHSFVSFKMCFKYFVYQSGLFRLNAKETTLIRLSHKKNSLAQVTHRRLKGRTSFRYSCVQGTSDEIGNLSSLT